MKFQTLALAWLLLAAVAQAETLTKDDPDVTEDGLVRVPSSSKVGVYRLPEATFHQYQRVAIAAVTVEFKKGWEKAHKKDLTDADKQKLRGDLALEFRKELIKELVDRGGYKLAHDTGPDTLLVVPSILDTDITAPTASKKQAEYTYVRQTGSMKLVIELRDSASGVVIGRLIDYESTPEHQQPQLATQISNLADFRLGFESSARFTHEALSVARSAKREDQSQIKTEN